jgi:hypothetical protein
LGGPYYYEFLKLPQSGAEQVREAATRLFAELGLLHPAEFVAPEA